MVDDGSSEEDRAAMRGEFPFFEYVLKPPHRKGHADSLNLLLSMVRVDTPIVEGLRSYEQDISGASRKRSYFMYLEDDWLDIGSSSPPHMGGSQ